MGGHLHIETHGSVNRTGRGWRWLWRPAWPGLRGCPQFTAREDLLPTGLHDFAQSMELFADRWREALIERWEESTPDAIVFAAKPHAVSSSAAINPACEPPVYSPMSPARQGHAELARARVHADDLEPGPLVERCRRAEVANTCRASGAPFREVSDRLI